MKSRRKYQLKFAQDSSGDWRWQLKHSNGRVLSAASEGFVNRAGAKRNFIRVGAAFVEIVSEMATGTNLAKHRSQDE